MHDDRLRQAAQELPGVRLAVLFGSRARGTARKDSDFDVGLLLEESSLPVRHEAEAALARAVGRTVDVTYLDQAPPLLRFEIARDGAVLVEREPYLWADFRARAMIDWWDWQPWARRIHRAAVGRLKEKIDGAA